MTNHRRTVQDWDDDDWRFVHLAMATAAAIAFLIPLFILAVL